VRLSRRRFLMRSGGLAAAFSGSFALSPRGVVAAVTSSAPHNPVSVGSVVAAGITPAGGTGIIPTEGFPARWNVLVGDHVVLAPSLEDPEDGVRALPVAHWTDRTLVPAELAPGSMLPGQNGAAPAEFQNGTVLPVGPRPTGEVPANVCVVDRDPAPGPDRVIAVRW
jgi:hypothetical protein